MSNRDEILDKIIQNEQIETVFQPIISLKNSKVLGYEALSRITSEQDFKNTEKMFQAANEHQRLWDLELLCRTKALEAAHHFMISPHNKKLFLNVNPQVIHDENFRKGFTTDFLDRYDISERNVIFEVSETDVMNNLESFQATVQHYQEQNFMIAIDDAGSGYSGLTLANEVNPNYIKLDMHLIRDIDKDTVKRSLVKGMIEFAKAANVLLIAEGVETYHELETLIQLEVHYAQGYYIQKPASEILEIESEITQSISNLNLQNNRLARRDIYNSTIKELSDKTRSISPDTLIKHVYDFINENPECVGLCVVEKGVPLGIITKEKLALTLSGRYGYTLHQNKPISTIMDREFLAVDSYTPVNIVSNLAMERSNENLYDFIVVTEDDQYIGTVTIKGILQKAVEMEVHSAKQMNPLTGLPGNAVIDQQLRKVLNEHKQYSVAYLDIDNFKAYNDMYGFEKGDLIIQLVADSVKKVIQEDYFIGHIGGDDFILIFDHYQSEDSLTPIIHQFEREALNYYHKEDIEKGYITTENRAGIVEKFPLVSLTAVLVTNKTYPYKTTYEITESLAGLKSRARQKKVENQQN